MLNMYKYTRACGYVNWSSQCGTTTLLRRELGNIALEVCVRRTGCWHQPSGLIVVEEGVSMLSPWQGRRESAGVWGAEKQRAAATMAGTVGGLFSSGYCHTR